MRGRPKCLRSLNRRKCGRDAPASKPRDVRCHAEASPGKSAKRARHMLLTRPVRGTEPCRARCIDRSGAERVLDTETSGHARSKAAMGMDGSDTSRHTSGRHFHRGSAIRSNRPATASRHAGQHQGRSREVRAGIQAGHQTTMGWHVLNAPFGAGDLAHARRAARLLAMNVQDRA